MDRVSAELAPVAERYALAWAAWAQRTALGAFERQGALSVPGPAEIVASRAGFDAAYAAWRAAYGSARRRFLGPPRPAGGDPGASRGYTPPFAGEVRLSDRGREPEPEWPA